MVIDQIYVWFKKVREKNGLVEKGICMVNKGCSKVEMCDNNFKRLDYIVERLWK